MHSLKVTHLMTPFFASSMPDSNMAANTGERDASSALCALNDLSPARIWQSVYACN